MASGLLGRTNKVYPPIWLSLRFPDSADEIDRLVGSSLDSGVPIDVTNQPALWGGKMRGREATLIALGTTEYENANDDAHACDLVQAHLIETLSAVGRDQIEIYYFRVKRMAEEYQLSGALQALELAKQEGHVGHIGICCDGPPFATLGAWQFHDAFETLLLPRNLEDTDAYDVLSPLAKERRVGIVTSYNGPLLKREIADLAVDHPVLVAVRSVQEVEMAIASGTRQHSGSALSQ